MCAQRDLKTSRALRSLHWLQRGEDLEAPVLRDFVRDFREGKLKAGHITRGSHAASCSPLSRERDSHPGRSHWEAREPRRVQSASQLPLRCFLGSPEAEPPAEPMEAMPVEADQP